MKIVRLNISEPSGASESVHYRLPVRIGRHPQNDCQIIHPTIERFHLELNWSNDRFVLRALGTHKGVLVRIADEMQELRGRELTTASRRLEFAIAGIWVRASIEEYRAHHVAETAQQAIEELLEACARAATLGCHRGSLHVLAALARGATTVRGALHATQARSEMGPHDEVVAALTRWAQASIAAVSFIEQALAGVGEQISSSSH